MLVVVVMYVSAVVLVADILVQFEVNLGAVYVFQFAGILVTVIE